MRSPVTQSSGFSLVEVTLALGVASIGLATIVGLLSIGTGTSQRALQASTAANLFAAVAADLRSTAAASHSGDGGSTSQQFAIAIPPATASNSTVSTLFLSETEGSSPSISPQSRFRLTLTFLPNTGVRTVTLVHLKLTWPAEASPSNPIGSSDLFMALDRN